VHFHVCEEESHERTSFAEHPPRSLNPSEESSRPEFDDFADVVPVVDISRDNESAATVIPSPAPICMVVAPGPFLLLSLTPR